ncbi:MAG TPA: hypothetical protein VGO80_21665 [Solirubrobacteraceae bacterium]|jgi:hypothetical protein|nr:hypothetical protein [Solirubrobacteraceae bacterium]
MRRSTLVVLAAVGLGLAAAPLLFGMFDRAPKGAEMMQEFKPFMTDARLDGFQQHIRNIGAGVRETAGPAATRLEGRGAAAHERFDERYPSFAEFESAWAPINDDMTTLLGTIQANAGNYRAVVALPSFELFPWFFLIPGLLVALLVLAAVLAPRSRRSIRWALVAIGIGLVIAPFAFQMFDRAPKGGRMMTAFETIETRKKVETMQGYFSTIAVGQGSLRLEIVPALRSSGLDAAQIRRRYPHVTTLNRRWIEILNDLTPMIGVMSDNVDNYEAISALPPFALFPWFFVIPGVLIAGLALATGRRGSRTPAPMVAAGPLTPATPNQRGAP